MFSQAPTVYYRLWTALDRVTDQSTTRDPNNAGQPCHSGLWGWQGGANKVRDDDFAAMVKPGVERGIYLFTSFSQCFGGGMFDELDGVNGSLSGVSASLHNQTSVYPKAMFVAGALAYTGNGFDFTFQFLRSMLLPGLGSQRMATFSAANDPWGPNPNPVPLRAGETQGSEQPVYFRKPAAASLVALAPQPNGIAMLWSGQPNLIDQEQIVRAIQYLIRLGYPPARIYVFYGQGELAVGHPVVAALGPGLPAAFYKDHIRQANNAVLGVYFNTFFNAPAAKRPNYIAFIANDHGFNTCVNAGAAAPRVGGNGIPEDSYDENGVGGGYSTEPPIL